MSETHYSIDQDLREAKAMADALVPYVHEKELYGKVGGGGMFSGGGMPSLTIGALLLRLRRLRALQAGMTPAQQAELTAIEAQHENVRREWRVHYTQKLDAEAQSRLKAMSAFFEECEDDPRPCAANYLPEAHRRTIVQEIAGALGTLGAPTDEVKRATQNADAKLRRVVEPSAFVWSETLQPAYPQGDYWWLYARPPRVIDKKDE